MALPRAWLPRIQKALGAIFSYIGIARVFDAGRGARGGAE